jgi:4-amino-4-deoxy-L-arabinose transferase-like glycosyltransferase
MSTTLDATPPAPLARREITILLAASAVAAVWLYAWSAGTQPTLGDEARHFRRAVSYYEAGRRLAYDPLYPPGRVGYFGYWDPCLWHQGLAGLWRLTGGPGVASAQLYHTAFLFLLGVFTYLAAREVHGRRGAAWAWALVLSVPTTVLAGTAFYMEVPMLAFAAMAFYFLLRRWAVPFGAALGLACLMKLASALALAVPILAAAPLVLAYRWQERVLWLAMALVALALVMGPELAWQTEHFGRPLLRGNPRFVPFPKAVGDRMGKVPPAARPWEIHGILEPLAAGQLLGATGLVILPWAVGLALARFPAAVWAAARRLFGKGPEPPPRLQAALLFGLPILAFLAAFFIFLRHAYNVRYLYPMVLPAALLVAGPLASVRLPWRRPRGFSWKRVGAAALVAAAAGQFLVVPWGVRQKRSLEPAVADAFDWIARNTPPEARIFYIEENLYAVTGRPIIWGALSPRTLFNVDAETQALLLLSADVRYIAVHPTRRMPTSDPREIPAAYPEDWIATLDGRSYLTKVYDSNGFLLYSVDEDRIPDEWKRLARPGDAPRPEPAPGAPE